MSLSGNFEELPAERRQQILSACIHEFAQHGYRGASTDRMAKAAGISKGLLFYHFKNKKNLYLYIVDYAANTMIERLSSMRGEIIGDFFDKLKLRLGWEEPELYKIIFESYTQTPADIKEELRQQYDTTFADTRQHYYRELDPALLKEGVDPKMAVDALMLLMEGMYYRKLPQFQQMSAEEVLKEVEKMQEEGIAYIQLLKHGICK
jgi:TetR/AcrR family transcriptional regulator